MQKQIIYLLESITKFKVTNLSLEYNKDLILCSYPEVPKIMKKGR